MSEGDHRPMALIDDARAALVLAELDESPAQLRATITW